MNIEIEKQIGMKVESVLGRGAFATVYYCLDISLSRAYAVKVFHKKDFTKHRLKSFRKEAEILASIQHKNVVKFSSFKQTDSSLYLIMQYIAGGTLKALMSERFEASQSFNDAEISLIIKSILQGIQYLHKFNIIHRDLKPGMYQNILIADPGDLGSIKIVDFGLSAQIEAGSPTNVKSQCGTLLYMAPQILHQPSYSKAVDIWSCAIIMYILYTGSHPIFVEGMKTQEFKQKLKSCSFPKLPDALADNFIRNLSKIEYTERYSVNEALRHPWITRNQQDEIPLSVSQSIQGFNTSHLIADTFKFLFFLEQGCQQKDTILEGYQNRLSNFASKHEQCRIRSPSYKKTRRKTNETISKLKELMINKEKDKTDDTKDNQYLDLQSPVLIKHQKLFLRLFDKNKVEDPIETLVVEECEKLENQNSKEIIQHKNKEQESSPILVGCSSFSSSRNNGVCHFDVDLPLIKLNPDKKQKQKGGGLRKLNSLREEVNGKYEHNYSYFKNLGIKNSGQKCRDAVVSSKSKRISYKFESFNIPYPSKNVGKKPQTAERGKAASKNKQLTSKPMTFGLGTHS